ncbi:DUF2066 domain-containing protein [Pseudidiomarina sediminum]|uniref:DUF2066 domain-containing protein n=1 Tax=Pseudidiomarina sediminum TaxID=431675 RepID=UPI001C9662B2|nr:DUF2066 domain-containing protein [Pseudidiomarina sediminum]MBY6062850.1 DUF2066 domain-containing protein [Pseudidiomarina sediminum]
MRQLIIVVALLLATSWQGANAAVELTDLYQHRVAVTSQANAERDRALQEALRATLLKLSGDTELLQQPAVSAALRDVRSYVVQYGYQQDDQLWLWAQFDQPRLDRLIQDAGSGIWSNLRPRMLVWFVAEDEQGKRELYPADSEAIVVQQLRNAAEQRGLPIQLPLMDLNDSMTVSVIDVWARFMDTLSFGAARYSSDGMVVARIYPNPNQDDLNAPKWAGDWSLHVADLRWRGTVSGMDFDTLGAAIIEDVTAQLAARYRISSQSEQRMDWTVNIQNLRSVDDTIAAEQFLAQLPSVSKVQLIGYGKGVGQFRMSLQTDPAQIRQAMMLSKRMQALETDSQTDFRWIINP